MSGFVIRPYRPRDRQAIRDICVATAWMGRPAPDRIIDPWIWAEHWTRFFTDVEPRHTWVAADSNDAIAGYLTGAADARRFASYLPRLLPGMIWRVVSGRLLRKPQARASMVGLLRSTLRGELDVPAAVQARYPATLHLDLLPQVRGQGIARQLFEQYREAMWKLRVPGIHAQTLSENAAIRGFNLALGFRPVQTQTLTAWSHLDAEPVQVTTWVLDLATSPCR